MFCSHQVVLRGPRTEVLKGRVVSKHAVSDLHVDSMDGGVPVTLYSCEKEARVDEISEESKCALRWRDVAVLSGKRGGRGVRVEVMRPGWCCLLFMETSKRMHGGVTKSRDDDRSMETHGLQEMRCVTYPLARILGLVERLAKNPELEPHLQSASLSVIRQRFADCKDNEDS